MKEIVQEELHGSESNLGYRRVLSHLSTSDILLRREDVRLALRELNPENVDKRQHQRLRRRKYCNPNPNYVWHIDDHDKLKPYCISIDECIEGHSRCIIWLEVAVTNKIAKYYLDTSKQMKGKLMIIKADDETEHSVIELLHVCFSEVIVF